MKGLLSVHGGLGRLQTPGILRFPAGRNQGLMRLRIRGAHRRHPGSGGRGRLSLAGRLTADARFRADPPRGTMATRPQPRRQIMHPSWNRILMGAALGTVLALALGSSTALAVERMAVLEYFTSTT